MGSRMIKAQPIETTTTGPQRLTGSDGLVAALVITAIYQITVEKSTTSMPNVRWWNVSRFESDSMLLPAAGNSATNSNGQHQVPKTLGNAVRRVVISTGQDTEASTLAVESPGPAGEDQPSLEHVVESADSESLSNGDCSEDREGDK